MVKKICMRGKNYVLPLDRIILENWFGKGASYLERILYLYFDMKSKELTLTTYRQNWTIDCIALKEYQIGALGQQSYCVSLPKIVIDYWIGNGMLDDEKKININRVSHYLYVKPLSY